MGHPRDGLAWESTAFELEPRWERSPQIDAIERLCRRKMRIHKTVCCHVAYHAEGVFNKVYLVQWNGRKAIMRVSLPVEPGHKTRGEVATLRWLQHQTNIPVPQVLDFDDSNKNEIGFEWILMEYMLGTSADKRWRGMSMAQKTALVEKVAEYQAQILFPRPHERQFNTIGTLDSKDLTGWNHLKSTPYITPGQLVDYTFFWGDNYCRNVPRGPFRSSQEWLISLVSIVLQELSAKGREAEDEADRELTANTRLILCKLLYMVPKMFPEKRSAVSTFLWHEDLSLENILVDHEGNITAVLDWECVSTMPSWVATRTPLVLVGLD